MIFFFLFIHYVSATSYDDCLKYNFIEPNASTIIKGARGADCIISCQDRLNHNFFCYSDVGFYYDIWYWIIMLGYIFIFCASIYSLYIMHSKDKHFNTKPNMLTNYFNITVSIIRIIWLALLYNNRTPDAYPNIIVWDMVLEKLGSSIILIEILCIILVWKNIISNTNNLQQYNNNTNDKLQFILKIIYIIITITIIPLAIIGAIYNPIYFYICNGFLGIIAIFLFSSSIIYSSILKKILLNNTNPTKKKLIANIQLVNNILASCGFWCIIITICAILKIFINPFLKLFVEWFSIYFSEIIILSSIIYSVSYKYMNKHISQNNHTTINTSAKQINSHFSTS